MLVKIKNLPWKVQISRTLLELRSGHFIILQMKVSQISVIQQFIDHLAESFTIWIFARNRDIF